MDYHILRTTIALGFLGYLLGSIPFGLIIHKLAGKGDIRQFGSGNIGATNAFRQSKAIGAATLFFDMLKGILAVYIAKKFYTDSSELPVNAVALIVGVCAVLGHVFPIWLKFKGGKGVATAIAVFFMTNWLIGLFVALAWLLTFMIGRISGLAAVVSFAITPLLSYFLTQDKQTIIANSIICALVMIRHHKNIRDLVSTIV